MLRRASEAASRVGGAWLAPLALVAVQLIVQFQIRPQPRFNDALMVMDFARRFPDLPNSYRFVAVPVAQHELRIGSILPTRVFQELFGYGQVSFYAWAFLTGILLTLATYWLAAMLFGRRAGVFAALVVALHPWLVRTTINNSSWQLLPDVPATALVTSAIALVVCAGRRLAATAEAARANWLLAAAGLCLGWAYLVREFAVLALPAVLAALILWRVPWRRWWALAAPAAAALLLEFVLAWRMHGDPFARWRVGASHTDPPHPGYSRGDVLDGFWHMLMKNPGLSVSLVLVAAMLAGAALTRRRGFVLCAVWFASIGLPLLLAAGLADPHHVSLRVTSVRYWLGLLPPAAIGAAGTLAVLAGRRRMLVRAAAAALLAAAGLAIYAVGDVRYMRNFHRGADEWGLTDARWSALRTWLHQGDGVIHAVASDGPTASTLDLMYRYAPIGGDVVWHGRVDVEHHRARHWRPRPSDVGGDPLLWSRLTSAMPPRPSDGWRLAWRSDNGALRVYVPRAARAGQPRAPGE